MLELRKVAVTGGLSCGKSSVCLILSQLGAYVVSADNLVHQLLLSDANLVQEVVRLLGSDVLVNGKLDRSRISRVVFGRAELLQALEELLHPLVYRKLNLEYHEQRQLASPPPLFVAEIPLLFETGGQRDYEAAIAVVADPEVCRARFERATGLGPEEFDHRLARQLSLLEKAALADYVIVNNGSLFELRQNTRKLYQELLDRLPKNS